MMRLRAVEPDLAMSRSITEHDGAMRTLRRHFQEVRHELRVLAQVNPTESGDPESTMGMDVEHRNTVLHGPLQGAPNRGGAHHGANAWIAQVFVVVHGAILTCEHEHIGTDSG